MYRMGLRDLGHITTAISEAANASIKQGKVSVNDAMGLDQTLATINNIELQTSRNIAIAAQRRACSYSLPNVFMSEAVIQLGDHLTKFCIERFAHPCYERHKQLVVTRVGRGEWTTRYRCGEAPIQEPTELDTNGVPLVKPWPRFDIIRRVKLNEDGTLSCSCRYFESCLCPCECILAVKRGHVSWKDFHFRWLSQWQSGRIPLSTRTFDDGVRGPTSEGVNFSAEFPADQEDFEFSEMNLGKFHV